MTCEKLRVELPAYVSGELDETSARQVAAHLEHCAVCTEEMKAVERLNARIATGLKEWVEAAAAPPGLEAELRAAIRNAGARPVDVSEVLDFREHRGKRGRRPVEWWRTAATAAAAMVVALILVGSLPESPQLQGLPLVGGLVQLLQGTDDHIPVEQTVTSGGVSVRVHTVRYGRDHTQVVYSLSGAGALDQFETGDLGGRLRAGNTSLALQRVQVDVPAGQVTVTFAAAPRKLPLTFELGPLSEQARGPWAVELGARP